MHHPILIALSGVPAVFAFFVQASTHDVTPWLSTGATAALVAALVYIAKQFSNGSIVARDTAEAEQRLAEAVKNQEDHAIDMERLTARVVELAERAEEREKRAEKREILMLQHVLGNVVDEVS